MYIIWNQNSETGIPIIDEQHRGIISTINSLHYFIQNGQGQDIIEPTLIMLKQYTTIHFKTEESLLIKAKYPNLEEHFALHKKLGEKTKMFSLLGNKTQDSELVLQFLKEWWLGHINQEDRKYIPFVMALMGN